MTFVSDLVPVFGRPVKRTDGLSGFWLPINYYCRCDFFCPMVYDSGDGKLVFLCGAHAELIINEISERKITR